MSENKVWSYRVKKTRQKLKYRISLLVLTTKFSVVGTGTNHLERIPDDDQDSIATLHEGIVEAFRHYYLKLK